MALAFEEIELQQALKNLGISRDYYYKNLRDKTVVIPSLGSKTIIEYNSLTIALQSYKNSLSKRGRKKNSIHDEN